MIWEGFKKNVLEEIRDASLYVLSSDFEGISNSLLEAMAVGMPVVSTDHSPGGARFLIKNGESGLLVPVGDAVRFAEALNRFANDEAFAMQCGKNASDVLVRFSPEVIINTWENDIRTLLN